MAEAPMPAPEGEEGGAPAPAQGKGGKTIFEKVGLEGLVATGNQVLSELVALLKSNKNASPDEVARAEELKAGYQDLLSGLGGGGGAPPPGQPMPMEAGVAKVKPAM